MKDDFKLLKFPEQNINSERLKAILIDMYSQETIQDEHFVIDGLLDVLENFFFEMDDFHAESAASKIIELRAIIERIYLPYL